MARSYEVDLLQVGMSVTRGAELSTLGSGGPLRRAELVRIQTWKCERWLQSRISSEKVHNSLNE